MHTQVIDLMKTARPSILAAVLGATMGMLAACNTVEGVGKDIQKGGEAIEDAAND